METLSFLTREQALRVQEEFGTPTYVYDERTLEKRAREVLAFPNAFGLTARYAMKACPSGAIVKRFVDWGLHIDASSGFEAERAMAVGVAPGKIQLTTQEVPRNVAELVGKGVLFNACSLEQLDLYGKHFPGTVVCVRINPGLGSGHSNRTNVGGPSSSFGIWHEQVPQLLEIAQRHGLHVSSMHTHIGSGTDPNTWVHVAAISLAIAARLPEVTRLSLGGGYKVARMGYEHSADLQEIGNNVLDDFQRFAQEHGRKLHLEVEPGTYLVANAGAVVSTVTDIVDTGAGGYRFLKVDTGMTEVLRPSLYGAQHPLVVVPKEELSETAEYLVAGHCCESGDILTPATGDAEGLLPRELTKARIGDVLVVEGAGAYCSGMPAKNYNSFPEAAEVLLTKEGELKLMRKRQTLEQMTQNEILV